MRRLQAREKITVAIGVAIVLGALVYGLTKGRTERDVTESGSLDERIERIHEYQTLSRSVETLSRQLQISIPTALADDQEMRMRQDLAGLAGQKGVAIAGIRRVEGGAAEGEGGRLIQFQLDFAAPYSALVRFMYALEHAPLPYLVMNISLGAGGANTGQVQGAMQVQGYLFPPAIEGEN